MDLKSSWIRFVFALPLSGKLRLALVMLLFFPCPVGALPAGQQVVKGQVKINQKGSTLTIKNSPNSIINWQSFSIGSNETVRFLQKSGSSAVLNRVTGQDPSKILGVLQSNGRVFLINPNGILFGKDARVDVNALVASTLNLKDQDFLNGKYNFGSNTKAGKIQNQGAITTPEGGKVYLIAPDVENSGLIRSPKGEVLLAAGYSIRLVDSANPNIAVVVSAPENQAVNIGTLVAEGGTIGIYGGIVSHSGTANADSASVGENGKIIFKASESANIGPGSVISADGPSGGKITLSSRGSTVLDGGTVSAVGTDSEGGDIRVLGKNVEIGGEASLDASGRAGGGTVLVGGGFQGKDPAVRNAKTTKIDRNVSIKADAKGKGDGGKVVVWADDSTLFEGDISARGGKRGGNGGSVEVSGKRDLTFKGAVDLSAPEGTAGSLLLDPLNFTIGGDITGAALASLLGTSNVTIQTGDSGSDAGDIYVNEAVTWNSANKLTLNAHRSIFCNSIITNKKGGSLSLRADYDANGTGTLKFAGEGHVDLSGGGAASLFYNPTGGYTTPTDYSGYFTGTTPTAYMLVNTLDDLQRINTNLTGTYALGKDIDASATVGWNGGKGFEPLGNDNLADPIGHVFTGAFDGNGHTISHLYINRPSTQYVGVFGGSDRTAKFRNLWLLDVDITGGFQTSGAVAHMGVGTTMDNSFVTGSVHGTSMTVGGLVALNAGTITNCYSKATVQGGSYTGGLVGANWGAGGQVINSYSAGGVDGGGSHVGGLVGGNSGAGPNPVVNSFWDVQTSGIPISAGGTGLNTAAMKNKASFGGWDFTNTWGISDGSSYPYLIWPSSGGAIVYPGNAPVPVPPRPVVNPAIAAQVAADSTVNAWKEAAPKVWVGGPGSWSDSAPHYASWDDYLKANPWTITAISWTENAPHYDTWDDYLKANPWFITTVSMNKSIQVDSQGRFIDGMLNPLDYLTTVGSGGLGFASLDQGGAYKGYSETGGSYETELAWAAAALQRSLEIQKSATTYDPAVAKMWQDAALAKLRAVEAGEGAASAGSGEGSSEGSGGGTDESSGQGPPVAMRNRDLARRNSESIQKLIDQGTLNPDFVVTDSKGNLHIMNEESTKIQQEILDGKLDPRFLSKDSSGNWLPMTRDQYGSQNLQKLINQGDVKPEFVAVDSKGNISIMNAESTKIQEGILDGKLDPRFLTKDESGNWLPMTRDQYSSQNLQKLIDQGDVKPEFVAVDSKGNISIMNAESTKIQEGILDGKLDPRFLSKDKSGNWLPMTRDQYSSQNLQKLINQGDVKPEFVAVDSKGNISIMNAESTKIQEGILNGTVNPANVTKDSTGNLHMTTPSGPDVPISRIVGGGTAPNQ
ncbi:MAG: filamentous hemagglutinin N-terminal domain-containing protein [Syntrophobacter sp.]